MLYMKAIYVEQADKVVAISIDASNGEVVFAKTYAKDDMDFDEIRQYIGEDHGIDNYFDIDIEIME